MKWLAGKFFDRTEEKALARMEADDPTNHPEVHLNSGAQLAAENPDAAVSSLRTVAARTSNGDRTLDTDSLSSDDEGQDLDSSMDSSMDSTSGPS